jgi:hypothetical protein
MIAGKFAETAVVRAVICAEADPWHARLTVGGVQVALAFAELWQLAWHWALALHDGGVTAPTQEGAVYATEHPPWQLPEQLMPALPGVAEQPPVQPPVQEPAQWSEAEAGMAVHLASHVPLHVPLQAALFTWFVPPLATHEPVQLPEQVPAHWTDGAVAVASHSPLQLAEHEPEQLTTGAVTEPWHVPVQLAEHVPVMLPGWQLAVTDGGVQLALPLQLPSQLASALTLT